MTTNLTPTNDAFEWSALQPARQSLSGETNKLHAKSKEAPMTTLSSTASRRSASKFKRAESIEFRLIFAAAFVVFLVAAIGERMLPTRWIRDASAADKRPTIVAQAKAAANTCAAYAFMG
jgi:hypothetical protein